MVRPSVTIYVKVPLNNIYFVPHVGAYVVRSDEHSSQAATQCFDLYNKYAVRSHEYSSTLPNNVLFFTTGKLFGLTNTVATDQIMF